MRYSLRIGLLEMVSVAFGLLITAAAAAAPEEGPVVVDLVAKKHIVEVESFYRVDQRIKVCVKTSEGLWKMWDPVSDKTSKSHARNCRQWTHARWVNLLVTSPPVESIALNNHPSFSGASSVYAEQTPESAGGGHCGTNFPFFNKVTFRDGSTQSFVLVSRLSRVLASHTCGDGPTRDFVEKYSQPPLELVDLGNGRSILSSSVPGGGPVLLSLKALPKSVLAIGADFFVIPKATLDSGFETAGFDPIAREAVVDQVLGGVRDGSGP